MAESQWKEICAFDDLEENWGEAALIEGHQYALFRTHTGQVFAADQRDPNSGSLVIARGIVGEKGGVLTITSPLYKEVYSLETGECLSGAEFTLPVYPVKVENGKVYLSPIAA
ncbi:MAG: nitrite reductase small subunit NirD [Rothia sp. (in: high G+C Gram-positive bacteria)]|nr:nitrite reductase small subunit NirD [Rothia sp. (in: high G+C Gram-positive bacteria)]